jgi:hypothetical protein
MVFILTRISLSLAIFFLMQLINVRADCNLSFRNATKLESFFYGYEISFMNAYGFWSDLKEEISEECMKMVISNVT